MRAVVAALVWLVVTHASAGAQEQPPGHAKLDHDRLTANVSSGAAAVGDDMASGETRQTIQDKYTYRKVRDIALNENCGGQGDVLATVEYWEVDPAAGTEELLLVREECAPIPELLDGPAPLPPPSLGTIRDAVAEALPRPPTGIDPDPQGITGMDTWLWDDLGATEQIDHDGDPDTPPRPGVRVRASAGPYSITAEAYVLEWRWYTGDGGVYRTDRPGSRDDPAAIHVYETKGHWTVTLERVWAGRYEWSTDTDEGEGDLGEVRVQAERDYPVAEVRSVLTG